VTILYLAKTTYSPIFVHDNIVQNTVCRFCGHVTARRRLFGKHQATRQWTQVQYYNTIHMTHKLDAPKSKCQCFGRANLHVSWSTVHHIFCHMSATEIFLSHHGYSINCSRFIGNAALCATSDECRYIKIVLFVTVFASKCNSSMST